MARTSGKGPSGRGERGPGRSGGRGPNYRRPGGGGGGTGGTTGGTRHKSSSVEGTPIMTLVWGIAAFVVLTIGSVGAYLLYGYSVL